MSGSTEKDVDQMNADDLILRFFRDDIGGILITDARGTVLHADAAASFVQREKTNWRSACPPPRSGQKAERWDLLRSENGQTYMVITSAYEQNGEWIQIHHLVDISLYMDLYRDMTDYSKSLRTEKDHDGLTGLYNKGKFMEFKRTLFWRQDTIAVFNMDVNNLKFVNDTFGHEAGDRLIRKAAQSLKAIEKRNVMPFRVGGDEFIVVAIHVTMEDAEKIRKAWEAALDALNRQDDGISCEIACGFAFAEKEYDLEEVLITADERMYEDKKRKKKKMLQNA